VEAVASARVAVVPSRLEAEMICALLRTEGIASFTRPIDDAMAAYGAIEGPHEVAVAREEDLPRAGELVATRASST
jgi:putative signal transducing protein